LVIYRLDLNRNHDRELPAAVSLQEPQYRLFA